MAKSLPMNGMDYLQRLVDQSLQYGVKSPDTELYDFGFGDKIVATNLKGRQYIMFQYTLHALCPIKLIWRNGEQHVQRYYGNTAAEIFHRNALMLMNLPVLRISLSDKNDLWLDFGDYWVVFTTDEEEPEEECWRFFTADENEPHLVATATKLEFHLCGKITQA